MKITTLVLLEIVSIVSSFDFQDPQQTGVEYVDQNSQVQVTVDEYNGGGQITIVQIINAEEKPETVPLSPNADRLEAEIQQDSDQYILQINLVDYESLVQENVGTTFTLGVKDSTSEQNLTINIKNLDDENPTLEPPLELFQPECFIMEETAIDINNSTCRFKVSDPDGWLNLMTFTITSDSVRSFSQEVIFELKYRTPPDDSLVESDVYLVLKDGATLDYEEQSIYKLSIEAKDSAGNPTTPNSTVISYVVLDDITPVWTILPDNIDIDEETEGSFAVKAIDPDPNHPKEIGYVLEMEPNEVCEIDEDTGLITCGKIDRDVGSTRYFLKVTAIHAKEYNGVGASGYPILTIDDIDDNAAIIYTLPDTETNITALKDKIFSFEVLVEDLDEGINSVYNIEIEADDTVKLAVDIFPVQTYGRTTVHATVDPAAILRNNPYLTDFTIELRTTGVFNPQNTDSMTFTIHLEGTSSGEDIRLSWVISTILTCITVFHLM